MQQLLEQLQSVGLSDREARVYLASLSQGPSTVQALAEQADISRSSAYVVVDALQAMGLVASVEQEARKLFRAEHPEHVVTMLRRRTADLSTRIEQFQENLPSFAAVVHGASARPQVRVFEGRAGIEEMFEQVSLIQAPYVEYVPHTGGVLSRDDWERWRDRWVKARSTGRVLLCSQDVQPAMVRPFVRYGCEVRQHRGSELQGHVHIRGDIVCEISSSDVPIGLMVQQASLAHCLRSCFNAMWEHAKELS